LSKRCHDAEITDEDIPVAAWDFSQGISTDVITDISAKQLPGRLVNLPTRGVPDFAPRPSEFYASFTGEYTGLWRRNGRAPNELAGVGMVSQGFDISSPYIRTDAGRDPRVAFIFGGAAGLELDAADHALGTPPDTIVLASSERHTDLYLMTPEDMNDPAPGLGGTEAAIIRADMVYFETTNKGAVFSIGSIAWAGSLSHQEYNNDVARISTNVLKRFLED